MADFTTLEKLYTKGIIEYNPKDYINGTHSDLKIDTNSEVFLPDSRFQTIDGTYVRHKLDKDLFESAYNTHQEFVANPNEKDTLNLNITDGNKTQYKPKFTNRLKNFLTSKIAACIVGVASFIIAGRYILKKLHIYK